MVQFGVKSMNYAGLDFIFDIFESLNLRFVFIDDTWSQ